MKKIYLTIIVILLVIISGYVQGQVVTSKNDSARLFNEPLLLKVDGFRGNVQWQYSDNADIWSDIPGKTGDTLSLDPVENEGWYRAKITEGTCSPVYSDTASVQFATPIVETMVVDSVGPYYAILSGKIIDDGGPTITGKGFYWSKEDTVPGPSSNIITVKSGTTEFDTTLTGLNPNTTYYIKVFASNSKGTSTGDVKSFKTLQEELAGTFVDSRDNKTYGWIKIGAQVWMAENLAYLPSVSPSSTGSQTAKHFYVYGYNGADVDAAKATNNYKTFGVLYNWPAAMDGAVSSSAKPSGVQGACSAGWHLPSDTEWEQLAQYISDQKGPYNKKSDDWWEVGKHLKATSGWDNNNNGIDDFGFSAFPGSYRGDDGSFHDLGKYGYFWNSMEYDSNKVWGRYLDYSDSFFWRDRYGKDHGFSVRCVRD